MVTPPRMVKVNADRGPRQVPIVGQFGVMKWSAYAVLEMAVRNEAMPAAMARKKPKSGFCMSPPKRKPEPMLRLTCAGVWDQAVTAPLGHWP